MVVLLLLLLLLVSVSVHKCFGELSVIGEIVSECRVCVCGVYDVGEVTSATERKDIMKDKLETAQEKLSKVRWGVG